MKKKILVIEDNVNLREILKDCLEINNYKVEIARNGQEGIMLLKKQWFDLVITDFRMPKMNGIEVIRWIKQRDPKVKTILISGDDMVFVEPVAKAAGADYIFAKPFDFSSLKKIINKLL